MLELRGWVFGALPDAAFAEWRWRRLRSSELVNSSPADDAFDGSNEAIAAASEGLNEARTAGRISEGLANAIDRGVHAVIEIDEGAVGPELPRDFFAREQFAGPVEKHESTWKGCVFSLTRIPCLRSSPVAASASKVPKR